MKAFCLILSLLLITWGVYYGPVGQSTHYIIQYGQFKRGKMFFGTAFVTAIGWVGICLSLLLLK